LTIASDRSGTGIAGATISADKNIYLGSTSGTSISAGGITGVITYNGVIADKTGSTGLMSKQDLGTLVLGGVSTYTGSTIIGSGTLKLDLGNDRLPTGTVVSLGSSGANLGTFDLNGRNQQIAGLVSKIGTVASGALKNTVTSTTAATLDINVANGQTSSYGAGTTQNSGVITGALALTKSGLGTQVLGDANTYTGGTIVNGGALVVNGSVGAVTVNTGGSLGGSGTVGAVTLKSGSLLNPGNSPGTLTASSSIWEGTRTLRRGIWKWW
jgi:autotransporter-associated beta strand protein